MTRPASTADPDEVSRLLDVATGESQAVADLDAALARMHEVQDAKAALMTVPVPQLRRALMLRGRRSHP